MAMLNQEITLTDGRKLGYDEHGPSDGKLLFYFHGTPSSRIEFNMVRNEQLLEAAGAIVDAVGGGGWGPVVASTLVARGNYVRTTVGSVNAAEFFVTLTASVTFVLTLGIGHWPTVAGLALGGVVAAPIGAWACKRIPHRPFLFLVGLLVIGLSVRTLLQIWC